MTFVVNGADWNFNGLTVGRAEELIEHALELVEAIARLGERAQIGDDFHTRPMYETLTLWELFSDTSSLPLQRELSQELAGWLTSAPLYADSDHWPDGFDDTLISINNAEPAVNQDVAWVHYSILAGIPAATVALGDTRVVPTRTATGTAHVHFLCSEAGLKYFWRDMIVFEGDSLESLLRHASHAYPELYFVDGVIGDANHLSGGYLASRYRIRTALETLNDYGYWAFTVPPPAIQPSDSVLPDEHSSPTHQLIEHRFAAFGLTASPEKPNVRIDRICREAREIVLGGRTLYCEWHVKVELHRNRIHFHGPVAESGNKVVIGMIAEHLPLPT